MHGKFLKPCRWCGNLPEVVIKILDYDGENHNGQCEVTTKCVNENCHWQPAGETISMLSGYSLKEAVELSRKSWNARFKPATPYDE